MKIIPFLLTFVLAAFSCAGNPAVAELSLPTRTPDGRFGTLCSSWGGGGGFKEVCELPFTRLLANPEKYQGKLVAVMGFLVREDGDLMLYPTRQSYEEHLFGEGISVSGNLPSDFKGDVSKGVWPTMCVGVFDATFLGKMLPTLGSLHEVQSITSYVGKRMGVGINSSKPSGAE
jgi:hypothetical protein